MKRIVRFFKSLFSINSLSISLDDVLDEFTKQYDADAQYNLGICYFKGNGVSGDDEAVNWMCKAADNGCAKAIKFLEGLKNL